MFISKENIHFALYLQPGKGWNSPKSVFDPSRMECMKNTVMSTHFLRNGISDDVAGGGCNGDAKVNVFFSPKLPKPKLSRP